MENSIMATQKTAKNGVRCEIRGWTATKVGKSGTVEVYAPITVEEAQQLVDLKLETWAHILKKYTAGLAIDLQRQAIAAAEGGKMPAADYNRLHKKLITAEIFAQAQKSENPRRFIDEIIAKAYADERS